MMRAIDTPDYDAIVIGSGFGGALAAYPLVSAGWRVLMLERGPWVERGPANWSPESVRDLSPYYDRTTPYNISGDDRTSAGAVHCVGGASVFYGGVSLRFREQDFHPTTEERSAGAAWPFEYDELERFYDAAERLIGVAGESGVDSTEPWRSNPYAAQLPNLSRIGCRIADAAERLGLTPFRLPLAINYRNNASRKACVGCSTCDCYPCAVSAKNDIATSILPALIAGGLELRGSTAAVGLRVKGTTIEGVECVDTRTRQRLVLRASHVILAAGALATPHLLLSSGLQHLNPAGRYVGRMLMRHCNSIVFGVFPTRLDAAREFHKQVGINDLYFGSADAGVSGKLGTIQQIHGPPPGLVRAGLPGVLGRGAAHMIGRMTGLINIATDAPQFINGVSVGASTDALGMRRAEVHHEYTAHDRARRRELERTSRRILIEAGAALTVTVPVRTFSHALGSVRTGTDPHTAPLDSALRFRGISNLLITDGSCLPTSAGVNPSLTIAAMALRAGALLAGVDSQQIAQPEPVLHRITNRHMVTT